MSESYPLPVDKLLTFGDCRHFIGWPNYLELGLGSQHIPDLIRMATDDELNWADSDSLEVWAPIHAWRALGQLRAEVAIEPLMRLFHELEESDWAREELPEVYGMIGPAAIPALGAYLADPSHDLFPRATAASSLEEIGKRHPAARDECVAALTRQLERFTENDPELNAFLIVNLLGLHARESAPVMERAFAADRVEEFIVGDWEDVQVALGLEKPDEDLMPREFFPPQPDIRASQVARPPKPDRQAKAKAKAKRKQAEKSRKKNRRRK